MNCPVCDDRMKEVERSGVVIDICPSCKGVWLDRGELDKLVAMGKEDEVAPRPADQRPQYEDDRRPERQPERYQERQPEHFERRDDDRHRGQDDRSGHKPRRRSSFLSDILESFGEGGD